MKTAARTARPYLLVATCISATVVTVAALGCVALLAGVKLPSPLSTTEVGHEHDVTVERLRDMSQYTAASQHLTSVVDIEEKADHLPESVKGSRVVFVAEGDVEATVDFSKLPATGIERSRDGKDVTVHLPEPQLSKPRLDPTRSSVVARERGILDRVEDAMSSTSSGDQRYYEKAEQELAKTADQTELQDRAETNTRAFITTLFTEAGYQHVTVVFDQPAPAEAA